MQIILETPAVLDELGDGVVTQALQMQIEVIWNTILGCVFMRDSNSIEHLMSCAMNIAEENTKKCVRELGRRD